jgi:hypothetical protein
MLVSYSFSEDLKKIAKVIAAREKPKPKAMKVGFQLNVKPPEALTSKMPAMKLPSPQTTLRSGDDNPLPGGLPKGVGNLRLEIPWTKWGMPLAVNMPARKDMSRFMGVSLFVMVCGSMI